MLLTIVIPNRNRNLTTVKRTLSSIAVQLNDEVKVKVVVIDYGSELAYQEELKGYIATLHNVSVICCPTQGQLWQKTRAINIVLKQCETSYFMVADMDMLFHPDFVVKIQKYMNPEVVIYFKVGILTEEESKLEKPFGEYQVKFYTNEEATGMTLFPTTILKAINGFDEFYHGWGSEDTDVHVRLRNQGVTVQFNEEETLLLHQWHPKLYRSKQSTAPHHSQLERINYNYLEQTRRLNKSITNENFEWGVCPVSSSYVTLNSPDIKIELYSVKTVVEAFCAQLPSLNGTTVQLIIKPHPEVIQLKTYFKKIAKKKTLHFLPIQEANNIILYNLIKTARNAPYTYVFDDTRKYISVVLHVTLK